ncbi:MAG: DegT/DnrJ/EryC1/StrS family aminotransferase [Treponema sp.]|jgi:dTDP-4-amino-4,6-dideoxygalactose transaminase|nr:DegT/DnrJ/EryC1/StrS family aminotransferase [Treponema sp.]
MAGGPGSYVFGEEEKKELLEVIENGGLFRYGVPGVDGFTHKVASFEKEMADIIGVKHTVATSSGTGSLLCCLAALGIGAGDEVIVPGYTFIASISSIILSNAVPVLAEIDSSLTIDPDKIEELISPATKAIMPVHMLGNPCDMDRIMKIAAKHKLFVIEDCCQAFGASYKGRRLGTYGDISAFSLNVFKTITAGDGGAVATDDDILYERAFGFHDQGHKPSRMGVEVGNRSIVGMNLRMNELTGAVSLAQIRKLDAILARLRTKKIKLKNLLGKLPHAEYRKINDEEGECATLLTLFFDTKDHAEKFCESLGTKPLAYSGWHVYNNMEQILNKATGAKANCPYDCPKYPSQREYKKHMLPQTDGILERAVNISIGVVDKGLGSPFGININSSDVELEEVAAKIKETAANL